MAVDKENLTHLEGDLNSLQEYFYEKQWTDGLPVIPPTPEDVEKMIGAVDYEAGEELGEIAPRWNMATVEKVAVNAVMAGCLPEYFPVVVNTLQALIEEKFNLYGVQATTNPAAPLIYLNGPVVDALGFNGDSNAMGPGTRANATVGRAIRLVLWNIGGGRTREGDMCTQGRPSKYSYCTAENESESPWIPLHVEKGFDPDVSTVSVLGAESPHNINDHESDTAKRFLSLLADEMAAMGCNNWWITENDGNEMMVLISPEHARTIHEDGWSKEDARAFLFEKARRPVEDLQIGGMYETRDWAPWMEALAGDREIPVARKPEHIVIGVTGGSGKHSCIIPTFGATRMVTRPIQDRSGSPISFD